MLKINFMLNNFLFIGLPYVAITSMLVGSIVRYKYRGYQVSSLSSQFLESRKLFFGSNPFHIGILFLFFGHLMAFFFPKSVIAFNSLPLRLFIIEISAFTFGLLALFGAVVLIIRRLNKRLLMVTSKVDILVYIVIFSQLISGLLIAYYYRWGSTWFASSLTPYLNSIFTFTPNVKVISEMPFLVKYHLVSSFVLIALIPFSRLMHILVFPFRYIVRNYQYFIWNRDRKTIRNSDEIVPRIKSKSN